MRLKEVVFIVCVCLIAGCSSGDNNSEDPNENEGGQLPKGSFPSNVTIIGERDDIKYQLDISRDGVISPEINLHEQLDLNEDTSLFYVVRGDILRFHYHLGRTHYSQKNLATGEIIGRVNICPPVEGEQQSGASIHSNSRMAIRINSFSTNEDFAVIHDIATGSCQKILLPPHVNHESSIMNESYLVLYLQSEELGDFLVVIDLESGTIVKTFSYGLGNFISGTINDKTLWVFSRDFTYQAYDLETSELVRQGEAYDSIVDMGLRLFRSKNLGSKMLLTLSYVQPNPVVEGPLIYDYDTGVALGENMVLLEANDFMNNNGYGFVGINDFDVDMESETIYVCGKGVRGSDVSNVGIFMVLDFSGRIIHFTEIGITPEEIFVRN
ncbi:hypothetical protein [Poritiphilus flavus]|uniref:Uncharacterized protein n=1 Tax=Poritiphilus flavus TaxID=2697053 RepID=A0A6L9EE27_9FLAO|nr:hypothetical protein [Poritiphilus flavus]NAS12872.1 hypothetical protein [Poritiphilus flavus]